MLRRRCGSRRCLVQLVAVCGEGTAVAPPAVMAVACGRGTSSTSIVRAAAAEEVKLRLRKAEREGGRLRVGRTQVGSPAVCTT